MRLGRASFRAVEVAGIRGRFFKKCFRRKMSEGSERFRARCPEVVVPSRKDASFASAFGEIEPLEIVERWLV